MKQIQIENGVIRYYGNRVGRVTEGCAVVDPMFQNEALESFLRKQRNCLLYTSDCFWSIMMENFIPFDCSAP